MAKKKLKTDEEILALIKARMPSAQSWGGPKLSNERAKALRYYNGELPSPLHGGDSKFVSQDVFDSVEGAKSMLLEAFSAGRQPVRFTPNGPEDVEAADIATSYVSHVVFAQNPGLRIMSDVIMDGLLARVGVSKTQWVTDIEEVEEEFENIDEAEFAVLLDDEAVSLSDDQEVELLDTPTGPRFSGRLTRTVDKSKVEIRVVQPENFIINENAESIAKSTLVGDRTRMTKEELRKHGATEAQLEEIKFDVYTPNENEVEDTSRRNGINHNNGETDAKEADVYDLYIFAALDNGDAKLWNVMRAGDQIIRTKRVDYRPYQDFTPIPIPHVFYGSSYASKVIPIQAAVSTLIRSIINHGLITNNPRYMVVKNALSTPRELMENRLGGIVNVNRPDGVIPLPQAGMNSHAFQTIQLLDSKKEDVTGVSRLSQGLDKSALSNQNSQGLVEQLQTLSMQRTKIIARQFGEYVKELFYCINRLVLDYEDRKKVVNVAGNWVEVDPRAWKARENSSLDLTLGYGEADKEFQKLIGIYQFMAGDPALGPMFGPQQRYNLLKKAFTHLGLPDYANFVLDPSTVKPPEPSPTEVLQFKMLEAQLEAQQATTKLNVEKLELQKAQAQIDASLKEMKAVLDQQKEQGKHAIAADKVDIEEARLALDTRVADAEIEVMNKAPEPNAIASPN